MKFIPSVSLLASALFVVGNLAASNYYTGIPKLDLLLSEPSGETGIIPSASVTGSANGRFVFNITVRRETANPELMECEAWIFHHNASMGLSYHEKARSAVVWQGNKGTCVVNLIYDWKSADLSGQVELGTSIMPQVPCECREKNINRTSSHDLPPRGMPTSSTWTTINEFYRI